MKDDKEEILRLEEENKKLKEALQAIIDDLSSLGSIFSNVSAFGASMNSSRIVKIAESALAATDHILVLKFPRVSNKIAVSAIGKKIKVIKGPLKGKTGTVTEHWIDCDDCSGRYGQELYALDNEHHYNNSMGILVTDCKFHEDSV